MKEVIVICGMAIGICWLPILWQLWEEKKDEKRNGKRK